jgi:(p)ppGpp synthase/HD superfamily hydrolase
MTLTLETFVDFVRERHADQTSMSGEAYIEHLPRVLANTTELLASLPSGMLSEADIEETLLVAVGHDLIEDDKATKDEVREIGGTESLVTRLAGLSRMEPKPVYRQWIADIVATRDLALIIVKLADNLDNNSDTRIASLPPEKRSIRKRYDRAFVTLREGLDRMIAEFTASAAVI